MSRARGSSPAASSLSIHFAAWSPLGSGSLIALSDGRYGMFFGAGNRLDNDSDGFHFIGYAETDRPVASPEDLHARHVVNGLDNPILATDTLTDTSKVPATVYYATNFFSGRAYDLWGANCSFRSQTAAGRARGSGTAT